MQYTVHGQLIPAQASLGKECWDQGVLKAVIGSTGVVALTATLQLWAIPDLKVRIRLSLLSQVLTHQCVCVLFVFSLLYVCLHRYMCNLICLTSFCLSQDPTPLKLPNPGLTSVPRCMEVVEKDGKLEVLLTRGGSLVAVNLDGMQDLVQRDWEWLIGGVVASKWSVLFRI